MKLLLVLLAWFGVFTVAPGLSETSIAFRIVLAVYATLMCAAALGRYIRTSGGPWRHGR